ncbi:ankyrin repeat and death domain-containing protein 1A-like isoform X2 [Mya arenaria]|uniref:ankyrin repeat and death domain-containing protein 1A-like isoform X2 n=1 Tax=Mya arenaria TaxID=6604 RepID=UPI0022E3245F|nr:ankyrin repeat and death domain-containing protein 1A-like isoform X2 [Mya arenaria]
MGTPPRPGNKLHPLGCRPIQHNCRSQTSLDSVSMPESSKNCLQIDEDPRRGGREDDCAMSTILQPTAMLRREVALHEACKCNRVETVAKLLQDRMDINCKNNLDRTPLHWACAKGHLPVVELLFEHGADLEAKDKYGMRALLWAALYGHLDVLRFLVNAGAVATCTNRQGMGLLHCAAQNNHIHVMNFIFEALENVDINCAEKHEKTALHLAAEEGHLDAVMRLIDLRADVNKRDADCSSAVHLAARHGHHEVVKRLLMVGVNVDDRDAEGQTALHMAAEEGHVEAVEVLLDFNAGTNVENIKEFTPLHCASAKGLTSVCLSLIKYGANINAQNHQGNTALHLAVMGNFRDLSQVLVASKAEIDLPNHRLQTALHVAVESGLQDVVEVLLVGSASLAAREKSGKTALHLAARGSFVTIVDMIVKAERYFSLNREYHDTDLDSVDAHRYLRQPTHPSWPQMKETLWTLATKHLKSTDWKKLAVHWKFTAEHIRCIEHQYTGTNSYKEHGFRLLMIWLHGVRKDENVTKLLFEALVAIDRRHLAEQIRRQSNCEAEKPCIKILCGIV